MSKDSFYEFRIRRVRRSVAAEASRVPGPAEAADKFRALCRGEPRELFMCASLDVRNRWLGVEVVSVGGQSDVMVHPREVFRAAILCGAAGIIVAHNHPSEDLEPSVDDLNITGRLADAGELLGIPLLDHIIITDTDYRCIPVP